MTIVRAVVFDFDGVILESVAIKGRAFRDLVPGDEALKDRVERYHFDHLGMSRYEKFAWIYRELLRRPLAAAEMADLDRRFGAVIASQMRACPFVPGASEFLHARAGRVPMFVASGTPERELKGIVDDRGLTPLFEGVYGCPPEKAETLGRIAREVGASAAELLFIGDGQSDADAARASGVTFVARVPPGGRDTFGDLPAMRVADLAELERRWVELDAC